MACAPYSGRPSDIAVLHKHLTFRRYQRMQWHWAAIAQWPAVTGAIAGVLCPVARFVKYG